MTAEHDQQVRDHLRHLRTRPLPGGFEQSLHRRLVEAGPPERVTPWWRLAAGLRTRSRVLVPAVGIALGVAAFFALGHLHGAPMSSQTRAVAVAAVELPSTKVAIVRVNLSADVAVEGASIRVALPDGLVFWSDGKALADRVFEWRQPLAAGPNEIAIPVRGERLGRYSMVVTAFVGDERIDHEVPLEVIDG